MSPADEPATVITGSCYAAGGPKCSGKLKVKAVELNFHYPEQSVQMHDDSISDNYGNRCLFAYATGKKVKLCSIAPATVDNGSGYAAAGPNYSSQSITEEFGAQCKSINTPVTTVVNDMPLDHVAATDPNCSGNNLLFVIDNSGADHYCCLNYKGSSGGMKSKGLLQLCVQMNKDRNGEIFYDTLFYGWP